MIAEKFFKKMFFLGSLWNLLGGIAALILTDWVFKMQGLNPPFPRNYYYSWIALFMTFGIGYYMVYKDMYANKNIVILGIIGKFAFACIFIYYMAIYWAQIPHIFLIGVVGDLIFVVLFSVFLFYAKISGRKTEGVSNG